MRQWLTSSTRRPKYCGLHFGFTGAPVSGMGAPALKTLSLKVFQGRIAISIALDIIESTSTPFIMLFGALCAV